MTDAERDKAREAMSTLTSYYAKMATEQAYAKYEGGYLDTDGYHESECSPAAEQARADARKLLRSAKANGLCGCPLCRN